MEKKINYGAARRGAEKIAGSNKGELGIIFTSLGFLTLFTGISGFTIGYRYGFDNAQ